MFIFFVFESADFVDLFKSKIIGKTSQEYEVFPFVYREATLLKFFDVKASIFDENRYHRTHFNTIQYQTFYLMGLAGGGEGVKT